LTLLTFFISGVGIDVLNLSQLLRLVALVVCNLGAFLSFTWLIQRVSALQVASIDYLVPVVGVTAGVLFLGETFNRNILISSLFIFASLLLTTKDEFSD
jgi:drug/metabolite transporter (DMT)-like permease